MSPFTRDGACDRAAARTAGRDLGIRPESRRTSKVLPEDVDVRECGLVSLRFKAESDWTDQKAGSPAGQTERPRSDGLPKDGTIGALLDLSAHTETGVGAITDSAA